MSSGRSLVRLLCYSVPIYTADWAEHGAESSGNVAHEDRRVCHSCGQVS